MRTRTLIVAVAMLVAVFAYPFAGHAADKTEITVSAAISLKNAFQEIGRLYEKKNGSKILFNFGASGDLMRQIDGGAPVDVFASAAKKDMDDAEKKGLIIPETRRNFAVNSIVLIVPAKGGLKIASFQDLKKAAVGRIAVGNPNTVPAGRYAKEVFGHYALWNDLKDKLVFTENVRQALDYVSRGEVEAGVVYSTDAAIKARDVRIAVKASKESHSPVVYPIAIVKGTGKQAAAMEFVSIVTSKQGKKILEKYGFRTDMR
jgi:molybdate transport system substrate-binding protein